MEKNPTFSLSHFIKHEPFISEEWVIDVTKLCVYITWPPKMTTCSGEKEDMPPYRIFIKHKLLTSEEWCVKYMYISITYTTGTKNENMNVVRKKKRLQEIVNFSKKWHHTHVYMTKKAKKKKKTWLKMTKREVCVNTKDFKDERRNS